MIDARRGEVFAAAYESATGEPRASWRRRARSRRRGARGACSPRPSRQADRARRWLAVGDGAAPLSRRSRARRRAVVAAEDVAAAPRQRRWRSASSGRARGAAAARGDRCPTTGAAPTPSSPSRRAAAAAGPQRDASDAQPRSSARRSRRCRDPRLSYPDLPQVIAIERRVFPTPWSLAMFVLELSKQSGICLAARAIRREERLVGYLICSRYDTVWHVMNVAVDPDHQRMGLASALLARAVRARRRRAGALHARGAPLQPRRDPPVRARGLPRGRACAGATTRTTARTRS